MAMADLVVVMGDNRVQQVGPPLEIYRRPVNRFVADFIGRNNLLPARVVADDAVEVAGVRAPVAREGRVPPVGTNVTVAARPENLRLHAQAPAGAALRGTVTMVRDLGRTVETRVRVHDLELAVSGRGGFAEGDEVWVALPEGGLVALAA